MNIIPLAPEVINKDARTGLILVCDHASNFVPENLNGLGLDPKHLEDHIAIDIGCAEMTRKMAEMMGVAAVLAPVSRLVIDCNRDPLSTTMVPTVSDGIIIPGNHGLDSIDIAIRKRAYYDPFHSTIEELIAAHLAAGQIPIVAALHSFTPEMNGQERPWGAGLLWNRDPRLAQALIGLLERETDLVIGDNEPYSGQDLYYTMQRHGADHGLPQATIEIRQDLLSNDAQITEWSALMADLLDECMAREDIVQIKHY
ncbi:N-formylglutamate amidohydrolase [Kordiimonas sediminis]|uniref:N-formylglutamate amidohydrolase n=1 Tax=Kordiimonas sediminis TaxID=1735581 RepID=A0A919E762_9PROT|nr:N-formylglutamate amidohydrolase [Kordiimonas sediminis]GHF20027.1 N-formylglutamate amidohydrolase [Kordiimonas sediminis]